MSQYTLKSVKPLKSPENGLRIQNKESTMIEYMVDTLDYGEFNDYAYGFDNLNEAIEEAKQLSSKHREAYGVYLANDVELTCHTIVIVCHGIVFHSEEHSHYKRIISDAKLLDCMRNYDVEQWEGYEAAQDLHYQENGGKNV